MMSKHSLWDSLKENNKRRLWIWAVSCIVWLLTYPVGMIVISSRRLLRLNGGFNNKNEVISKIMTETTRDWLCANEFVIVLCVIMAVITAIQGFSYLYSKKKMDFYKSMPVSEPKRFLVITINGFFIFFIPFVVSLILGMVVAAVNGAKMMELVAEILIFSGEVLLLYLGIFALTALAVMLTGQLIITLFAVAIFMSYEMIILFLLRALKMLYFDYYSGIGETDRIISQPIYWLIQLQMEPEISSLLAMIAVGAVFFLLAYLCFRRRPAEAAGKAMAFPMSKPIVKFLLVIPAVLSAGTIIADILGEANTANTIAVQIFIMVLVLILASGLIEVIYEMDIKAALRKKRQILWSGLGTAAVFCIFFFDLTGYDAWIPKQTQLSSGIVMMEETAYINEYWSPDLKQRIGQYQFYQDMEGVTDLEAILDLSGRKLADDDETQETHINLGYRMKSGKVVWRNFAVGADAEESLNRIVGSQEYKEQVYQIYNEELFQNVKVKAKVSFDKGISVDNLPAEDLDLIRSLLLEDMKNLDFSTMYRQNIVGKLEIETPLEKVAGNSYYGRSLYTRFELYPEYVNVLGYLADQGIYMDGYVKPEDVLSITVTNYHSELDEDTYMDSDTATEFTHDVTVTYDNPEQIKEILGSIYPSDFSNRWMNDRIDFNYSVEITLKKSAGNSAYYRGYTSYNILKENKPAFLEQDTAFQ